MSTPTLCKSNSLSSWGVKQCLKVAVGLVALSQFSITQACSPSTISISYDTSGEEFCIRKACSTPVTVAGMMSLTIRGGYDKSFYYETPNGKSSLSDIGKRCSSDRVFCIEFYGPNDATLHYANRQFKLGSPNVEKGSHALGSSEYWNCL